MPANQLAPYLSSLHLLLSSYAVLTLSVQHYVWNLENIAETDLPDVGVYVLCLNMLYK